MATNWLKWRYRAKNLENYKMKLHKEEVAYLSGFLDGDGSLITQIVRDNNYQRGFLYSN